MTEMPKIKPEIIRTLREWAEFEQDGGNAEQGAAIDIILDWYDRQQAALKPPVEDGWVRVPKEPTKAMRDAGWRYIIGARSPAPGPLYAAMLAASTKEE